MYTLLPDDYDFLEQTASVWPFGGAVTNVWHSTLLHTSSCMWPQGAWTEITRFCQMTLTWHRTNQRGQKGPLKWWQAHFLILQMASRTTHETWRLPGTQIICLRDDMACFKFAIDYTVGLVSHSAENEDDCRSHISNTGASWTQNAFRMWNNIIILKLEMEIWSRSPDLRYSMGTDSLVGVLITWMVDEKMHVDASTALAEP